MSMEAVEVARATSGIEGLIPSRAAACPAAG